MTVAKEHADKLVAKYGQQGALARAKEKLADSYFIVPNEPGFWYDVVAAIDRDLNYQPKTGIACGCRRGIERDNCPACEGTGKQIDFAAIRARSEGVRI